MSIRRNLIGSLGTVLFGLLCVIAGPGGGARAQAPAAGPIQPWGLPPLPQGVGPVENLPTSAARPRASFLKAARSTPREICGLWPLAAAGFRI
jgi:hypothetical protein